MKIFICLFYFKKKLLVNKNIFLRALISNIIEKYKKGVSTFSANTFFGNLDSYFI